VVGDTSSDVILRESLLVHKDAQNEIMKLDDATAEEVEHYRRKIKKKAIR
jgi:hypothetical protein